MLKYICKRILMLLPVMVGVVIIVFTMLYITPGDAAEQILGSEATEEELDALREELGLNDPYLVRLGTFFKNLVCKGDFGTCWVTRQPVLNLILERFPYTLRLASLSILISLTMGLILGIVSAIKPYGIFDNAAMSLALVGVSMPNFWQGLLLMLLFALNLGWFPATGVESWKSYILPAVTIGTSCCAVIARLTRSSMLDVINSDYVTTARAKGQKESVVILRHCLKNALIPIITAVGIQFGGMLGGSLLTETVFAIPGIGLLLTNAIKARNYPVVQGGVLFVALIFSTVNLAVDVLYALFDPRIKSNYT